MNELTMTSEPVSTGIGRNLTLDASAMNSMVSLAEIMSTGKATIPREYQGSPGDCLAVVMQSVQWGMNPFAVAQKTHFVSGKIGYEAQLVNAVINSLAPTKDRLHFEWFGDWTKVIGKFEIKRGDKGEYRTPGWKLADEEGLGIKVWATLKGEDEPRVLELLLAQARTRNSTLWADDPKQQLAYLATKRWSRLYCPDVIMGVYTPDELEEEKPERDITPQQPKGSPLERLLTKDKPQTVEQDYSSDLASIQESVSGLQSMTDWQAKYTDAWQWASSKPEDIQAKVKQIFGKSRVDIIESDINSAIDAGDYDIAMDLSNGLPEQHKQAAIARITEASSKSNEVPV